MTPGPVPATSVNEFLLSLEPIIERLPIGSSSLHVNFVSKQSNAFLQFCILVFARRNFFHQLPLQACSLLGSIGLPSRCFNTQNTLPGAVQSVLGLLAPVPRIPGSFCTGAGVGWNEHTEDVFHGCEKFFRPDCAANLISSWIPSLYGVEEKLEKGANVADVGCGKDGSTLLMAKLTLN